MKPNYQAMYQIEFYALFEQKYFNNAVSFHKELQELFNLKALPLGMSDVGNLSRNGNGLQLTEMKLSFKIMSDVYQLSSNTTVMDRITLSQNTRRHLNEQIYGLFHHFERKLLDFKLEIYRVKEFDLGKMGFNNVEG